MFKNLFLTGLLVVLNLLSFSQSGDDSTGLSKDKAVKVYIDCDFCELSYFKENFQLINYVRDRKEADVHIIITEMETGSGGSEFTLFFRGRNKFSKMQDTLSFSLQSDYTRDEKRTGILKQIQLGLIPYILKTPFAEKINVSFENRKEVKKESDPWNYWVFQLHSRGYGQKEKSYGSLSINNGFSAQKVTEEIKIQIYFNNNYNSSKYRLYDGDSLIYKSDVYQRSNYFNGLAVKSLGDHWGAGGFLNIQNSTYNNYRIKINPSLAVEYNVFKYSEATRKQLRILYSLGYLHNDYIDTTIYNVLHDRMFNQQIRVFFRYVTKWGSLDANISGKGYLNNLSFYMVSGYLGTSLRLFKGFSINFWGNFELPHDQFYLRKELATPEEILTRQHAMQSNYSLWVSAGISYTFGSIYNNVVNPRFD